MTRKGRSDVSHAGSHGVTYENVRHSQLWITVQYFK